ncbi:MAG: N-acetylmuramoyl-L-alanine amidase [Oscillospiraceae bacterium]
MKATKRLPTLFLALFLTLSLFPFVAKAAMPDDTPLNAMVVRSLHNADFPSAPNRSARTLRRELAELTDYAAAAGYNAILFEARPQGDALYASAVFPTSCSLVKEQGDFTFFDPLKEMIRAAKEKGLAVYVLVDPYAVGPEKESLSHSHPGITDPSLLIPMGDSLLLDPRNDETIRLNAQDLGTMAKKYKPAGIVLQNLYPTDGLDTAAQRLVESVATAIEGHTSLGVVLPDSLLDICDVSLIAPHLELMFPVIDQAVGLEGAGFAARLSAWQQAAPRCCLVPLLDAHVQSFTGDLPDKVFAARTQGVEARAADGYRALRFGSYAQGDLLASVQNASSTMPVTIAYAPAQALTITRPTGSITTTATSYFLMGTSNPAQILTIDGKAVDRKTADGVFGVLVKLSEGTNTFTLRQGNSSETVTIRRTAGASSSPASAISTIVSAWPVSSAIAPNGESLTVTCTAPAGSSVTASVGGITVSLKQKSATAVLGIPASFVGTLALSGAANGTVKSLGPVSYTLSLNGKTSTILSKGNVYACGDGARPTLRVIDHVSSVFPDDTVTEGSYRAVYKAGTLEDISSQMGEYYRLASGGYIKKSTVEVLESEAPRTVSIKAIEARHTDRAEQFVLVGTPGLPYTFVDGENGVVTLTLHGITALPEKIDTNSSLFSSIVWSMVDGELQCVLTPVDPNRVWGVDLLPNIDGDGSILYLKGAPRLSGIVGRPLENLRVVLDPGHGGNDSGALSVLGANGADERELNWANAIMLKMRLEQLGASVTLTRDGNDDTRSLYERMAVAEEIMPDCFIAIHHNSVAESVDAYLHSGVEAYYYEPFGKALGEAVVTHVAAETAVRDFRHVSWDYYTVTRMRYTPSILVELAFVPNPLEYRRVCDPTEIYKTANAITAALLERISSVGQAAV